MVVTLDGGLVTVVDLVTEVDSVVFVATEVVDTRVVEVVDVEVVEVVDTTVVEVVVTGMHWEYHGLSYVQTVPEMHMVGPGHCMPPPVNCE